MTGNNSEVTGSGQPLSSKDWDDLRHNIVLQLAREYHSRCDAFDEEVCTGPPGKHGGKLPATMDERIAMARHSLHLRRELREKLPPGVSYKAFERAIFEVAMATTPVPEGG